MPNTTKETIIVDIPVFEETNNNNYNLILLNDDLTPMGYVTFALATVFEKDEQTSDALMRQAHENGSAVIDTVSYETGKKKIEALAILNMLLGFNLRVTMKQN